MATLKKLKSKKFKKEVEGFTHRLAVTLVVLTQWSAAGIITKYSQLPALTTNVVVVALFTIGLVQLVTNLRGPND